MDFPAQMSPAWTSQMPRTLCGLERTAGLLKSTPTRGGFFDPSPNRMALLTMKSGFMAPSEPAMTEASISELQRDCLSFGQQWQDQMQWLPVFVLNRSAWRKH